MNNKQQVLVISNDGSMEFLIPLSLFDLKQIHAAIARNIENAEKQAFFSPPQPQEEVVTTEAE